MFCESTVNSLHFIMAALWNRQAIIFLLCGFFYLLSSSFFLSSPNVSRRRLDVYHTSTHGEALVRIQDAGMKRAARGWLKIQDVKNRHFERAMSSQLRDVSTIGEKSVKQQYLLHTSGYGERRPNSALCSTPQSLADAHYQSAVQ